MIARFSSETLTGRRMAEAIQASVTLINAFAATISHRASEPTNVIFLLTLRHAESPF